jgi:putative sterol carrier protein
VIVFSTDFWGKLLYNGCMSIEDIKSAIAEKLKSAPQIGAIIQLDMGDDGIFRIDGTVSPPVFLDGEGEVDTTFICSAAVLLGIINGTQDPTMAFMMGKLKVQGSMGYAMKLNSFLAD